MTAEVLLSRLQHVRKTGAARWRAGCPAHGRGVKGSLVITETPDGRVLMHCHAECETAAVLAAVGLEMDELFPPKTPDDRRAPPVDRPFKREAIQHLARELTVAMVILRDLADGRPVTKSNRARAGEAATKCAELIAEIA